ncbi:DUF1127 domain-containing protein [Roseibacterium beibuensis]|uniref:DUF1127 domain-containing protein n=1 Tax=[Roseibacterium] beibuensis TaxID=1193142 RepID=A0ABP9L511_9RHOB|nr:DUF1127 domain-containing protein [Roseibacterium beibuensis]MCS6623858.1 DUF1127 domain-containing protein [Roseibacterium beibuensis]
MTTSSLAHAAASPFAHFGARVAEIFAAIAHALSVSAGAEQRIDRIHALQALSDAELAERGIARDDIVAHVFDDFIKS